MLSSLIIKNLALIESLQIELTGGLNIVTGETGAGKSIVIGAVQLVLGQRADKSLIRSGATNCEVTGIFELDDPQLLTEVNGILEPAGVPGCEEAQLIIRRTITEKTSRCFVNSSPVTLSVLKDLGDLLIDVHGPYDHQSLLKPVRQMSVLDAFGDHANSLTDVSTAFSAWKAVLKLIEQSENEAISPDLVDLLKFQIKEIGAAKLKPGEDDELNQRHAKVANASQLAETIADVQRELNDQEDSILDRIAHLIRSLQGLAKVDADAAHQFMTLLESAANDLKTLVDDLDDYASDIELDPKEFDALEARLSLMMRLKRKYGGTIERVLAFAKEAEDKLARLENVEQYREGLRRQAKDAEDTFMAAARKLSKKRRAAASKLAPQITAKLKRLGFPDSQFEVAVNDHAATSSGIDGVEFIFAPNPGEGSSPLREIASSGEISRVMLAVKTVLASSDNVPLLIFDEVDANIGGVVAVTVGEELRALGRERQVLCITHQPQVAAGADRHFRVAKAVTKGRTSASMETLSPEGQIAEIARMLGGETSSKVVREHAEGLIANLQA